MGILDQFKTEQIADPAVPDVNQESTSGNTPILSRFTQQDEQPVNTNNEFEKGVASGTDQLQMSLFGVGRLVGRELGIKSLEDYGNVGVQRNQKEALENLPDVQSFSQIESMDDMFSWMASALGSQVPNLAFMAGTGGVGGAIAKKAVAGSIKKTLGSRITRSLVAKGFAEDKARLAAEKALASPQGFKMLQENLVRGVPGAERVLQARTTGRTAGALGVSATLQTGEIDNTLTEAGIDAGFTSILGGLAGGALEALPALRLLDRVFPGVDRAVSKSFVKDFAKSAGIQISLEGSTEAAQEVIQLAAQAYHDPGFDLLDPANATQVLDAFAAGALVGGVSGGAADLAGAAISEGPKFAKKANKAAKTVLPEYKYAPTDNNETVVAAADNTFLQELGTRIDNVVTPAVTAAMNTVRNAFQGTIDEADTSLDGSLNGEINQYTGKVAEDHNQFVEDSKPFVEDLTRWVREKKAFIAQKASAMVGPDREAFIADQTDKIKTKVAEVTEGLRKRGEKVATRTSEFIDGQQTPSQFTNLFENETETDTRFVFGKNKSEGEEAQGFKTREQARAEVDKLRKRFPSATDSTFQIRERDDGFVVALEDSGQGDALRADQNLNEGVEAARKSARGNPNKDRQISIQREGVEGRTNLDVPTLVHTGKRLLNNQEANQREALAEVAAAMLDRGMIDAASAQAIVEAGQAKRTSKAKRSSERDRDFDALPVRVRANINRLVNDQLAEEGIKEGSKEFFERKTELRDARMDQLDTQLEGKNVDLENAPGNQGDEAAFVEEGDGRKLETEDTQAKRQSSASVARRKNTGESAAQQKARLAAEQAADRAKKQRARRAAEKAKPQKAKEKPPANRKVDKKVNSDSKAVVFLPGVAKEAVAAVTEIVGKVSKLLSDKTKVRIINREAAQRMVDKGHVHAPQAEKLMDHGGEFVVIRTADGVTYVMTDNFEDAGQSLAGLIHELGHAIHYDTWSSLDKTQQDLLWKAFVSDVEANKRGTGADINLRGQPLNELKGASINIFEFKEWMADQFVDWMNDRKKPQTALQHFMETVADRLEAFWSFLRLNPSRYGLLNETYAEFLDAVAKNLRSKDPSGNNRFYLNEGAAGRPIHLLNDPTGQITPAGATEAQWLALKERLTDQYPAVVKRAALISKWMHNAYHLALAPSTSVMRSVAERAPAARKLISIFNREEMGKAKQSSNYHQRLKLAKGRFLESRYVKITEGMTDAQKSDLLAKLRARDGTDNTSGLSLRETQMRKLFDDMHEYMKEGGLPVGKIANYFPRTFAREKLIAGEQKILAQLEKTMSKDDARAFYNSLISQEADSAASLANVQGDEVSMQSPSFRNMRSRTAQGKFFDQFLDDNLDGIMGNYIVAAAKKTEFNRFLGAKAPDGVIGGDAIPKKVWNSRGQVEEILQEAEAQGASPEDLKKMKNYVDANLGMYGRDDISNRTRTAMAAVVAYQNMRVLLFTVFASLPDVVGPAIRSGDMRGAFKSVVKNMRSIVKDQNDLADMSRAWGVISSAANQHVLTEYVDNHYMPPTLRKWNDAYFKWTGLNYYTDVTRKMALAVGVDSIKHQAQKVNDQTLNQKQRDRAKQFLAELGLNSDMVDSWVARGEPVFGSMGYDQGSAVDEKVAEALVQFVDESIMSPNPSQRPILASHPAAMLVYHLKGYIYAMHDIILKRLAHNFNIADTPAQVAAAIAPAFLMIALTAMGLELRELVTGDDRTNRMDGWDYTWEVAERSGLTGIAQLGFDFEGAGARGQAELAALSGPAIGQLADLISKPASQTIPKAIPIVSQLPWARDALRESTPL